MSKVKNVITTTKKRRASSTHSSYHPRAKKDKHYKPFRFRHVGLLVLAVILFVLSMAYLSADLLYEDFGFIRTKTVDNSTYTVVDTGYGMSYALDLNAVDVEASNIDTSGHKTEIDIADLRSAEHVSNTVVRPIVDNIQPRFAGTSLTIDIASSTKAFKTEKAKVDNKDLSDSQVAAKLYEIKSNDDYDVKKISETSEPYNGIDYVKTVYEHSLKSVKQLEGVKTYSVQWAAVTNDRPFTLTVTGLISDKEIPVVYLDIIRSVTTDSTVAIISTSPQVLGDSTLNTTYVADLVSPAVVKVYHGYCADITIYGEVFTLKPYCNETTGSGFIVSNDGYIATNGHVVVTEPADLMVEYLYTYPGDFVYLLQLAGMSEAQAVQAIQSPEFVASYIASIYELQSTDSAVGLKGLKEKIYVALGKTPVDDKNPDAFFGQTDSSDIAEAELIDYDFKASDFYNDDEEGFTASDVAVLKANLSDAPTIKLFDGTIKNSQDILVVGFPADAENALVDNSKLAVTVTDGTISSIREINGTESTVYQTNADASHGNSGGPAVTEAGDAFGLLTYVFQSASAEDSAKTYIRSIDDLTMLLDENSITINAQSDTQDAWRKGLELYSTSRFSKAIPQFEKVAELYPAHRLADSYIDTAEEEIAAGHDVKDFPVVFLVLGIVGGLALAGVATVYIIRHRKHHEVFKQTEQQIASGTAQPYQPPTQIVMPQNQSPQSTSESSASTPPPNDINKK